MITTTVFLPDEPFDQQLKLLLIRYWPYFVAHRCVLRKKHKDGYKKNGLAGSFSN